VQWHRESDWIEVDYVGPNLRGPGVLLLTLAVLLALMALGVRELTFWPAVATWAVVAGASVVSFLDYRRHMSRDGDE
jgi:membrane protein implicated in regulation of membrane protease activity